VDDLAIHGSAVALRGHSDAVPQPVRQANHELLLRAAMGSFRHGDLRGIAICDHVPA
jgi:hypothetical protein